MIKKISRRRRRFHRESSDERRAVHYSTSIARVRVRDEKKKQQKVSLSPSQKRGSKERCLTFASYFTCFMCPRLLLGSFVYLISKESEERPEKKKLERRIHAFNFASSRRCAGKYTLEKGGKKKIFFVLKERGARERKASRERNSFFLH
jgi:hypothetical protein